MNIQARVNKSIGIVRGILTMLEGIPFGEYHFEAGVILLIGYLYAFQ